MKNQFPTIEVMIEQISKISHHAQALKHHAYHVSELAKEFGQYLGLCHRSINRLIIGGFLHDIGKSSFNPDLLSCENELSQDEILEIKQHPMVGLVMVSPYIIDIKIREIILFHHERVDGLGYPMQLKGDEIPYLAKIISIVDAFDAMTSPRPYQVQKTYEESLEEIKRHAGTQFDCHLAHEFIRFIHNKVEHPKVFLS